MEPFGHLSSTTDANHESFATETLYWGPATNVADTLASLGMLCLLACYRAGTALEQKDAMT